MLKRALQRLLANPKKRLYVVSGKQLRKFDEPRYSTNPRHYKFEFEGETESPRTFSPLPWELPPEARSSWERPPTIVKAFAVAEDAIDFAYCCNLDSVMPFRFDRINGEWVQSTDQSAFDIDW